MKDISFYKNAFDLAKSTANMQVNEAFQKIQANLISSINNLRAAGQSVTLNLDEIEASLNAVRDEWLNHLRGTFDTHIIQLKATLQQHYAKP